MVARRNRARLFAGDPPRPLLYPQCSRPEIADLTAALLERDPDAFWLASYEHVEIWASETIGYGEITFCYPAADGSLFVRRPRPEERRAATNTVE